MQKQLLELCFPAEYSPGNYKAVAEKINEFEKSSLKLIAVDLSLLSMLRSDQIGLIAKVIKINDTRGCKTVLYVKNESIVSILNAIHFNLKTIITRDREEFEKVISTFPSCKAACSPPPSPPIEAQGKTAFSAQPMFAAKKKIIKGSAALTGALIVAIVVIIFLSIYLVIQKQTMQKERVGYILVNYQLQKNLDSLKLLIEQGNAEDQLMNELNNAGILNANGSKR